MKIKKGDIVKVISGKDRDKKGKVLALIKTKSRVIIEKINIVKKHQKQKGEKKGEGGIAEIEAPIDISNVMLICPSCNKSVRVGFKYEDNKKVRYCRKCKSIIS